MEGKGRDSEGAWGKGRNRIGRPEERERRGGKGDGEGEERGCGREGIRGSGDKERRKERQGEERMYTRRWGAGRK